MFAARAWWMLRWLGHRRGGGARRRARWRGRGPACRCRPRRALGTGHVHAADRRRRHGSPPPSVAAARRAARARPGRRAGRRSLPRPERDARPGRPATFPGRSTASSTPTSPPTRPSRRPRRCATSGRRCSAAPTPADVVMYCGSGVTACHNLLALEHAGLSGRAALRRVVERVVRRPVAAGRHRRLTHDSPPAADVSRPSPGPASPESRPTFLIPPLVQLPDRHPGDET